MVNCLRSLSFSIGVLSLALWSGLGASAEAQSDVQAQARAAFKEGVRQFEARNYDRALISFQEAYNLKPHHAVRLNIASCYEQLGNPVKAVENYEAYLY
ncbi:MAG: hypothetical protein IPJ88_18490 [Myxococcales bacterium]|nr:MAG: hypothetical protein IPJ88_18490 [Myxococcales bacterium]